VLHCDVDGRRQPQKARPHCLVYILLPTVVVLVIVGMSRVLKTCSSFRTWMPIHVIRCGSKQSCLQSLQCCCHLFLCFSSLQTSVAFMSVLFSRSSRVIYLLAVVRDGLETGSIGSIFLLRVTGSRPLTRSHVTRFCFRP